MAIVELGVRLGADFAGMVTAGSHICFIMLIFDDILRYFWAQIGFVFYILKSNEN